MQFTAGNAESMRQVAHIPIFNSKLYDESPGRWVPVTHGPLDPRLVCIAFPPLKMMNVSGKVFRICSEKNKNEIDQSLNGFRWFLCNYFTKIN